MALLDDILIWTETLPMWQRDACRRLLQKEEGLEDTDYSELYALLKKHSGIEVDNDVYAAPLAKEHLPSEPTLGETVRIVALRDFEDVNRIPNDRKITFSETGMTVIYGGNGTGKSGYARVMKRACRARDQSENIHPNANDPAAASKIPTAKFDIKVNGVLEEIAWSRDSTPPTCLSSVSVFDAKCARSYITAEQDVAYLPYGLDIVENLANQVLPKLSEFLDAEIVGINVDKSPFEHLVGNTKVGDAIKNLTVSSSIKAIEGLGTLTEDDIKRIADLEKALREANPLDKAEEFRRSATRLKIYAQNLTKPLIWVSAEAVEKLKGIVEEKRIAEIAEAEAAESLRSGEELLPETGNQAWKVLYEAARRYSTESAFAGEKFPPSAIGTSCPLCQEDLPKSATDRLKRFDEYIKNDVAKTADAARQKVQLAKNKIEIAALQIVPDEALSDELAALDSLILPALADFQGSINERRALMLKCIETTEWDKIPNVLEAPRAQIRRLAAHQIRKNRTLVKAADEETRENLKNELSELSARQNLSKSLTAVISILERMKMRAVLENCRSSLKTRPISDKSKAFATAAVTEELRKSLDIEFAELGIGHIKTKLRGRGSRGKMLHQLLLDLPTTNKIDEILSEGEQRAIALGSFFAELTLANHTCGIVFDDPVSSLDHWRRQNVARRLVKEAKARQVIVFTHDTSFLGQLCDEINAESIPNSMLFLEWKNSSPGAVSDGLPWDHQSYKARIDALEQSHHKLVKTWPAYPGEPDIDEMRHQYGRLRATLERVIQDVVFNGVVKRYRDWIRVDSLEDVVGFHCDEYEAIAKLHKRSCDVITAHDQSSAKAASVPSATDLGKDVATLKSIVEMIKERRAK
ncbi:MAG: AAA family ATPase [Luteolibacter sp.]